MKLNLNLEKLIAHYQQSLLSNNEGLEIGLADNNEQIEMIITSLVDLRNLIINHEFTKALTSLKIIKKSLNETQFKVIEETIVFYQTNIETNYPLDYQNNIFDLDILNAPNINLEDNNGIEKNKLIEFSEKLDELKNLRLDLEPINQSINSINENIKTLLSNEVNNDVPINHNALSNLISALTEQLEFITNPTATFKKFQDDLTQHINDSNLIISDYVKAERSKALLGLQGDIDLIKSVMQNEAKTLITQQSEILNNALANQKNLEQTVSKHKLYFLYYGGFVLLASFIINIGVSKYMSNSTVKSVISYIEQLKSTPQVNINQAPKAQNSKKKI